MRGLGFSAYGGYSKDEVSLGHRWGTHALAISHWVTILLLLLILIIRVIITSRTSIAVEGIQFWRHDDHIPQRNDFSRGYRSCYLD